MQEVAVPSVPVVRRTQEAAVRSAQWMLVIALRSVQWMLVSALQSVQWMLDVAVQIDQYRSTPYVSICFASFHY